MDARMPDSDWGPALCPRGQWLCRVQLEVTEGPRADSPAKRRQNRMRKILENRSYVFETGIKLLKLELEVSCVRVGSLHQVARVLKLELQHQSFQ